MKKTSVFFSLCLMLLSTTTQAITMKHLKLEQLSEKATLIFHGKVINNYSAIDPQSAQIVTYTTFEIIDLIKGQPVSSYTIKQLGGHLPNTQITQHVPGVPRFKLNNEYIVFLPTPSKIGFCTPLGFQQGSFNIRTINNEKVIVNTSSRLASQNTNPQLNKSVIFNNTSSLSNSPAVIKETLSHNQIQLNDFIKNIRQFTQQ